MKRRLLNLSRLHKQALMMIMDQFIIVGSLWLAFSLRLGDLWPAEYLYPSWWLFVTVPLITTPILIKFGMYRAVLQYTGIRVITSAFKATSITCLFIGFLVFILAIAYLPRSVLPIFWFISNVALITTRFLFKGLLYSWDSFVNERKQTIIYGSGEAGVQLVESLKKSSEYAPVAFIDDDTTKQGTIINYIEVYPFQMLNTLIKEKKAKVLLYAIPSSSPIRRTEILKKLTSYPIEVKTLPSVENLVDGNISIDNIRHVDVEDILERDTVEPKQSLLKRNIANKNILITGAGGSIGSELSRQIKKLSPKKIVLYDHSEFSLYNIHQELTNDSSVEIVPMLATVVNYKQLTNIMNEHNIQTIYHAAAYKHVPMVEMNVIEGVYNNVIGTYYVAKAAMENNVENMVLISTDKAVRPTNIMGASKRFSELILQAMSDQDIGTCFSMVRFGNVLDSAGSVVPLFRKQIKAGGPVTVTHRNITRYFMSIPEAVQLVLQSGAMAKGGDVFILDMGEPIKILDLAYKMIHLSGLQPIDNQNPDGDIKIEFTGLRPGEKLYEELLIGNNVVQSEHPRIMQATEEKLSIEIIEECIYEIRESRKEQSEKRIKSMLYKYVSGYSSGVTSNV